MSILHKLVSLRKTRPGVDDMARLIADRATDEVQKRLGGHLTCMSPAEARGYVRARAARPIRHQMELVLLAQQRTLSEELAQHVLDRATERTVHLIVREALQRPQLQTLRLAS